MNLYSFYFQISVLWFSVSGIGRWSGASVEFNTEL